MIVFWPAADCEPASAKSHLPMADQESCDFLPLDVAELQGFQHCSDTGGASREKKRVEQEPEECGHVFGFYFSDHCMA